MEIKDSTIGEILDSERDMVIHGAELYGEFFTNASELNDLLINSIKSIDDPGKFIFLAFLSQIRKHHTLALFSTARRHHVQAGMDLRQVYESTAWAAYAMGNSEDNKFYEIDKQGTIHTPDRLGNARNEWLNANYKTKSDEIKNLKKILNESIAHSNVVYTCQNFKAKPSSNPGFLLTFKMKKMNIRTKLTYALLAIQLWESWTFFMA